MKNRFALAATLLTLFAAAFGCSPDSPAIDNDVTRYVASTDLEADFRTPPDYARPRAYWWWLEGNISREGILEDLTQMHEKGIRGAIVFDAGSSSYNDTQRTEPGPVFMSPEWQELFLYACTVADSLGVEISLNLGSGWNDGGPWVTPELSSQKMIWSETDIEGGRAIDQQLPLPDKLYTDPATGIPYYVPYAVLAVRLNEHSEGIAPLENFDIKAVHSIYNIPKVPGRGYNWEIFMKEEPSSPDEYHARLSDVIDLTERVDSTGRLRWDAPAGRYRVMRFVYTGTGITVSTHSPGGGGLAIDYMSSRAMDVHFDHIATRLIEAMPGPEHRALKYLHDDSWELGAANWTPAFAEEFEAMNGYAITPYLPVLSGLIVENREVSNRFLYDFRRTIADLLWRHHYVRFRDLAHSHGLALHPESGGPHPAPIDALKNLGTNDIPMGEFWCRANTHRIEPEARIYIKQPAAAAHTYGKRFVQAEGPTNIGLAWEEDFYYLKPTFDRVFCEGLNRLVIHTYTHSPRSAGLPGNEYFAGTHFNNRVTWWEQAPAFLDWVSRNCFMLAQGLFVADVCYYYGDNVPNQVPIKQLDPSLGEGYDYDVTNTEVLLTRMSVRDGRIVLPDGMSYRVLVLPDRKGIRPDVLKKIGELVHAGATVVGPRPESSVGLRDRDRAEKQVRELAEKIWGPVDGITATGNRYGKGKVVWGRSLREVLEEQGAGPDLRYRSARPDALVDYIHRTTPEAEIYYVANRLERAEYVNLSFRVDGLRPELWDPETGTCTRLELFAANSGRVELPLLLKPFGSTFVVFREPITGRHATAISRDGQELFPALPTQLFDEAPFVTLPGGGLLFASAGSYTLAMSDDSRRILHSAAPGHVAVAASWCVHFDPAWGGPDSVWLDRLIRWNDHADPGIRYYSGMASYENTFTLSAEQLRDTRVELDLGELHNLAAVAVNGHDAGIWWSRPFVRDVTPWLREGINTLRIEVVNLWPNRLIGDTFLLAEERYTRTNVRKFNRESALLPSGLEGPVQLKLYPLPITE